MRAGVIVNPGSTRNLTRPLKVPEGIAAVAPQTPEALAEALRDFAAAGIDAIVVVGGDGTVRELMSALPEAWTGALPPLALVHSGNSNVIAGDLGGIAHEGTALARLLGALADDRPLRQTRRRPLEVRWPDKSRSAMRGMVIGAGAFERATHYARSRMMARGVRHRALIAGALATALLQAARGVSPWADGAHMRLTRDGDEADSGARFLLLATALDQLTMGIWPFWDQESGPDAGMRFLDVDARPPGFARAIWPMLRGRPTAAMRRSGAYRSGRAQRLWLQLDDGALIIDGESFAPDGNGCLEITLGPELRFLQP